MKTGNDECNSEDRELLDAVLEDEHWLALKGSLKQRAVAEMGRARRRRQLRVQIGQAAFALILLGSMAWVAHSPDSKRDVVGPAPALAPAAVAKVQADPYVTEEEMLAMFPPGTCMVAEVNGQREVVFLDPDVARKGFLVGVTTPR